MNLIGHVIKSCEAQMASRNIWLRTNQVHIMVNTSVYYMYLYLR